MPSPDVSYVLDSLSEMGYLSPDVHAYVHGHVSADRIVDSMPSGTLTFESDVHHLERWFLDMRGCTSETDRIRNSAISIFSVDRTINGYISNMAVRQATNKSFDDNGVFINHHRRCMKRLLSDLNGIEFSEITDIREGVERSYQERMIALDEILRELTALGGDPKTSNGRQQIRTRRKAIKRSVNLLGRMVGMNTVRAFINGNSFRIEGRLARYEFHKSSPLHDSHGGSSALLIFDKEHDVLLGRCCVYTHGVPLADHISGLILRIRSGLEEEILETGNISPTADGRRHPIIGQYVLPERGDFVFADWSFRDDSPRVNVTELAEELRPKVMDRLFDGCEGIYGLIEQTKRSSYLIA